MGLFSSKKKIEVVEERQRGMGLLFNGGNSYSESMAMKLSAVYCATNQISNSVAMLPIDIVKYDAFEKRKIKHNLWNVLNLKPDDNHTHFIFMKQLVESMILQGNGYALIVRDEQLNVIKLIYLRPDFVTVIPQADGKKKYLVNGLNGAVDDRDMIHLYMHQDEIGNGISLLKYAYYTLQSNSDAEKQARNYFSNGGSLNGIIKASATLTKEQKQQIQESWNAAFTGNGSGTAILPQGLDYQQISVDPADQQLLESREFGISEIARFWCIPVSKLMVWNDVSYNALEYSQLIYLTDTLQPYVELIKNEFNTKLFKPSQVGTYGVEFNYENLLVTDNKSKIDYYRGLLVNGICSLNEVREKMGFEKVADGDHHYMQLAMSTLENINNATNIKQAGVDNKVKIGTDEEIDNKTNKNKEE